MKERKRWLCLLCTLLILLSSSLTVYGEEAGETPNANVIKDGELDSYFVVKDRTLAPYFVVKDGDPSIDRFPLKDTTVVANVNGIIADVYVTQTYVNEGTNPINASYVFPASSSAAVHGLKITVGDQTVTAQIKEKEEAKEVFEEAKSEGKVATLMEQQRPNVFTMDVANIMPGMTTSIELHYTEMIQPLEGLYEFSFPTVVGPRYVSAPKEGESAKDNSWAASPYLHEGETPDGTYNITVNLSAGVPVTELSCKTHKVNVIKGDETAACITLADSEDYAGNRDFILQYRLTGEAVQSGLLLAPGEAENFFMLTVQPPQRYQPEEIPPREYIFVLDISGSMYGHPIDTAKSLISDLVSSLNATDSFNLILFSDEFYQLAPASLPANAENIQLAIHLIEKQEGCGGTEMTPALQQALAIPADPNTARSIVTITDGYICDEQEIFRTINENMGTTSFFSFGIGTSVNTYLTKGIATAGLGESFVVTNEADAQACAQRFRNYISAPLLTNIQIEYDGFDVYDVEPSVPSTLFAQKPIVLFGKWQGEPSGTIKVTGKSGNADYLQEIPVKDGKVCENAETLGLLWARSRLQRLTDYGCTPDNPDTKAEVTRLGLTYNMMTSYTSFVAVIDTVVNPDAAATDVEQANPLPLEVSDLAVGSGYSYYSEPGIFLTLFMATVVILFIPLRRRRNIHQ
ncbi:VIT and VWA domain-containing protein [Lachnospiraceae bacterium JLR.KK008]